MNVFTETITSQQLEKIRKKDWYRHGAYRDTILFASLCIPSVGSKDFKEEWLPVGMPDIVRLDE